MPKKTVKKVAELALGSRHHRHPDCGHVTKEDLAGMEARIILAITMLNRKLNQEDRALLRGVLKRIGVSADEIEALDATTVPQ